MKRKIRIPIYLVLFCFLTILLKSCVNSDDYDFDKLSDKVDWQPNFVAPVGHGEFTLQYLLDQHEAEGEDQTIYFEEDGIHIKYTEEDIFSYDASEVLDFPNQTNNVVNLDLASAVGIPLALPLILPTSSKIFSVSTDDASIILKEVNVNSVLNFILRNPLNTEVDLEVKLLSGKKEGTAVIETYTIEAGAPAQEETLDLTNLLLAFIEPISAANNIELEFTATIKPNGGTVTGTGNLNIQYQIGDIELIMAKGDFGDQRIEIGLGDINLDIDFWDDIDGSFTFANPEINLRFNNQVGVPIKIDANMTASNSDGITESLDPNPNVAEVITPNYPKTEADVLAGIDVVIPYNKDNSNVVALLGLPPSGNISYSGFIEINKKLDGTRYDPLATDNNINIISGTSSISADLDIDIPLNFNANDLSISDTIDEVDIDDAEKMIKAAIIITAENGLPLDVKIESINFTDADYNVLSTISGQSIINAAAVTASGDVDTASIEKVVNKIELTDEQIKTLNDTENIILKLAVSTYDDDDDKTNVSPSVKLKGTDVLKFTLSINAQLDLSK